MGHRFNQFCHLVGFCFLILSLMALQSAKAHDNEFCQNSYLCGDICHDTFEAAGITQDSPSCLYTCPNAYEAPNLPYTLAFSVACSAESCEHYCNRELLPELGSNGECVGGSEGCPVWKVNQQNLNIYTVDTPIWYDSPVGPNVEVKFSYNSRDQNIDRHGVGRNWVLSYASYLKREPVGLSVYLPDGGLYFYNPGEDENGFFTPFPGIYATLKINGSGQYELADMDGTTLIYDSVGSDPDYFSLVEWRDVHGKSLIISHQNDKLDTVTDALGRVTSFTYTGDQLTMITDPFGRQATLSQDTAGDLVSITDMGGLTSTITYDADGYISSITKPQFGAWQFDVEPNDELTGDPYPAPGSAMGDNYRVTVTDPEQNKTEYFYSAADDETWVVQANQYVTYQSASVNNGQQPKAIYRYSNDFLNNGNPGRFRLEKEINELGYETSYQYDTKGLKIHENLLVNDPFPTYLRWENYTYNFFNQLIQKDSFDPSDHSKREYQKYEYLLPQTQLVTHLRTPSVFVYSNGDNFDRLTYTEFDTNRYMDTLTYFGVDKIGNIVYSSKYDYSYNGDGQLISLDGPRTDITDVSMWTHYNCSNLSDPKCGQPDSYQNALGHIVTFDAYAAGGVLTKTTDANGLITEYDYDGLNRLTKYTQYPISDSTNKRETVLTYIGAKENLATIQFPDGLTLNLSYDSSERLIGVIDNLGNELVHQYDSSGNLVKRDLLGMQGALQNRLEFTYDLIDRLSTAKNDTSQQTITFDARNRFSSHIDAKGNTAEQSEYDGLGRLRVSTDPLNGETGFTYDPTGQLEEISSPNGAKTTYHFNDLGYLLEENSPDSGVTTYTYDDAGNVISQTDARGVTATFTYDALNRLTQASFPDASENISYVYDNCTNGIGRLCSSTHASGTSSYQYDPWGNVTQVTNVEIKDNTTIGTYVFQYSYDAANRVTQQINPNGLIIDYTRDAIGRVTDVTATWNGTVHNLLSNRQYRADGQYTQQTWGNGITETRQYDLQGRLFDQTLSDLGSIDFQYDANGNLTHKLSPALGDSTFGYDALNRVDSEVGALGTWAFSYDANGNLLTQDDNGQSFSHTYNANSNQLTQAGPYTNTLDAAGNTTSDFSGGRNFTYNDRNQLSSYTDQQNTVTVGYQYNAFNLRTRKEVALTGTGSGNFVLNYQYDLNGQLNARYYEGFALLESYIWLDGEPIAKLHADPNTGDQKVLYLVTDHLMTPRLGLNETGQITWAWISDAYGRAAAIPDIDGDGNSEEVHLRFPGQYFDVESGLHYNWHRYYEPRIGRYITSDPIGLNGGLNTYSYVLNNPMMYADPYGLLSMDPVWEGIYDLTNGWSPSQGLLDFTAGFGDGVSFGITSRFRRSFDISGGIDRCSRLYLSGIFSSAMTIPTGRLGYMYQVSRIPQMTSSARVANSMRNHLKWQYRKPFSRIMGTWGMKSYLTLKNKGYSDARILSGAGRANKAWNRGLVGGGTIYAVTRTAVSACGCSN